VSLPTLTDLRAHTNKVSTADDDELQDVLDAAIDVVTGIAGPIDSPASVTETHYSVSSDVLVLKRMPVAALTAVSSRSGSGATSLLLADYEVDGDTGLVRSTVGGWFRGTYTVTYTSGRDDLPAAIRLAVLVIAEHLWETQRGAAPVGPLSGDDTFATPGLGYAIPNRALELLAPYRRPAVA
jgi:uncharacterized phiE125 gp8 family phage protein